MVNEVSQINKNTRIVKTEFIQNIPEVLYESALKEKLVNTKQDQSISSTPWLAPYVELNSLGYRSDNFITTHNEKHILFAGCSVTFGEGLKLEEMWTHILYQKILETEKLSGYFNLALRGASILSQIASIFKYCMEYGMPQYIFFGMPGIDRFYSKGIEEDVNIYNGILDNIDDDNLSIMQTLTHEYCLMLEFFCKSNGIDLISFTWINDDLRQYKNYSNFSSFINIDKNSFMIKLSKNAKSLKKNNPKLYKEIAFLARDNNHYGLLHNATWSEILHERYLEIKNENTWNK